MLNGSICVPVINVFMTDCLHELMFSVSETVRVWDIRPFAPKERCVKIFQGNVHNFEKVSLILSVCYSYAFYKEGK